MSDYSFTAASSYSITATTGMLTQTGTGGHVKKYSIATITDAAADPTAADYLKGMINHTDAAGANHTWTLPTGAALADALIAAGYTMAIGISFDCTIINQSGDALTLEAGATGSSLLTVGADLVIGNGEFGVLKFVFSVVTADSEVYIAMLSNP